MAAALACKLEAPDRIRLGEPLVVRCVVTNETEDDYYILSWSTPLDGVNSPWLAVWKDGKSVPYDGRLIKRAAEPPPKAYVLIPARGEVESKVDVTEFYPIDAPGRYELQIATVIRDYAKKAEVHDLKARAKVAATAPHQQPLTSNRRQVEVEGGPRPKPTLATKVRQELAELAAEEEIRAAPRALFGEVRIDGGDAAGKAVAREAWHAAYVMANASRVAINSDAYNTWFGDPGSGRREYVDSRYDNITRAIIESGTGTYPNPPRPYLYLDLTGQGCDDGIYGYTYRFSTRIWLCSLFWSAPATGIDSQAGTIVHELSHAWGLTEDIVYGTAAAQNLAATNADQAIRNADNYEYFAESVPQVSLGPYGSSSILPIQSSTESKYHR